MVDHRVEADGQVNVSCLRMEEERMTKTSNIGSVYTRVATLEATYISRFNRGYEGVRTPINDESRSQTQKKDGLYIQSQASAIHCRHTTASHTT